MPKKSKANDDICAVGKKLQDDTERAIMATALKQGQEQIKIHRTAQTRSENSEDEADE